MEMRHYAITRPTTHGKPAAHRKPRPASHHALSQHCSEVPLVRVPKDSHAARASCHFVVILSIYEQNSAWAITLPFPLIEVALVCPWLITGPSQSPSPVHPH